MPQTEIAELTYRLHPADLSTRPQRFTISAISVEGLEAMQPVAHFQETRKKLVLSAEHCRSLILLSGSGLFTDWVGLTIQLAVVRIDGLPAIHVLPIPEPRPATYVLRALLSRMGLVPAPAHATLSARTHTPRPRAIVELPDAQPLDAPRADPAIPTDATADVYVKPILVIGLLSVVSFLLARTYGSDWLNWLSALVARVAGS